ncbi:hypothetical protein [Amycolatopsis alkalitolerans]|uniref:hypothetical protein n=1 Tax=Amycolatopsis alkalitolerans TaxID=2547244 RepID=UPI0013583CB7|nr:hypothetical protein [Amycolatopsis alkalitolerans]
MNVEPDHPRLTWPDRLGLLLAAAAVIAIVLVVGQQALPPAGSQPAPTPTAQP